MPRPILALVPPRRPRPGLIPRPGSAAQSGPGRATAVAATLALVAPLVLLATAGPAQAAGGDLAVAGSATASQSQDDADGAFPASNAVDGDPATRWASGNGPDEDVPFTAWLGVDLGVPAEVDGLTLRWEAAYASSYEIQVATGDPADAASWSTVHTEPASDGGVDEIVLAEPVDARHVRVQMLERVPFTWDPAGPHWYGYSLFAVEVHGTPEQPAVVLGRGATTVAAGASATVPLVLNAPAAGETSVRVTSGGGTAVPGTDYTAVDEVVTFSAGETTGEVTVATVDHGPLAPVTTFDLTIGEPVGAVLGARTTTTVTITPHGDLPDVGPSEVLDDFEAGVPAGYTTWGSAAPVTPVLATVESEREGAGEANHALEAAVAGTPAPGDWFGFTHDLSPAADWSAYDGFSFWFLGTGAGGTLRYELKSGGRMFERSVVDDTEGWRRITVPFAQLRLKGDPTSDERFDAAASTGFAVTLTDLGAGAWRFDDVALYQRVTTIQDFEGDVPVAEPGGTVGHFTWGSDGAELSLAVTERDRDGAPAGNHVLSGDYLIPSGGWGGYSHNLAAAQDWSGFRGIRFLWYASQDNRPASPTAGADIKIEVKDGGPDGEHSELWATTFKDNWSPDGSRWKLVEIPFTDLRLGGYQPGDEATRNGTLDLTSAWGYALTMVPGTAAPVGWAVDDVELYGSPAPVPTATVAAVQDVVLVDRGDVAQVPVRLTTTDGAPLPEPVTVAYANAGTSDTAEAGTHYEPFSGTLTFDAGTPSGTEQTIEVRTLATEGADDARSVEVTLTAEGADVAGSPRVVLNATGAPYLDATRPTAERVEDLLGRMTLAEKVGQMAQAERLGLRSEREISGLGLGSLLSGGGSVPADNTPAGWADMIDGFQREALSTRLQIPLVYGVDAVHGHSNVVGATILPHNSGLGASRDPELVRRAGEVTALEVRGTGVPWTFSPCLCVTRDERWGRSYESFGEDPALVTAMARAAVVGLQGEDAGDLSGPTKVLATAKHWVGDGGTRYEPSLAGSGYPIDQGVTHVGSLDELRRLHVDPYLPALEAGVGSIMPSYSAVDSGDGPVRMHENGALNTGLLKDELGFDGFLISDWEGIDKLPGGTYADKVARSVNAGLDMAMAPYNYGAFITALTEQVGDGTVPQVRVDDAVRRILTQKFALGLFEQPRADRTHTGDLGSAENRAVAREAAAASQVLLKNSGDVLPLAPDARVYVAGSNADDLGHQMGGWSISWQGGSGDTTTGTTILEGIREVAPSAQVTWSKDASAPTDGSDVGVVVVGEPPYAEGIGDVGNNGRSLELPAADRAAIDTVCGAMPCVVLVVAGRPQLVTDQVEAIDGLVASWLPGTEGAGVADTLFGARPFTGRLPVTWPATAEQVPVNVGDATYAPLYAYGWGVRTDAPRARLEQVAAGLPAGDARHAVQAVLDTDVWSGDALSGERRDVERAVRLLAAAAATLDGGGERFTDAGLVVSLVRDLAQFAVAAGGAPDDAQARTADAEHALMAGRAGESVALLAGVLGVELTEQATSTTTLRLAPSTVRFGRAGTATVSVTASEGRATGTVELRVDGTAVATAELPGATRGGGAARVRLPLPAGVAVGTHGVTAVYLGDASVAGSTSPGERYRVLRTSATVSTAGTDWDVRRADPKVVAVAVGGVAGVAPTGTVDVLVNGRVAASSQLGADGRARVRLPASTRTSLVTVVYRGDATYTAALAWPRVLVVR